MKNSPFRTLCGDAREELSYQRLLSSEQADVLLTDPPYCLLTRRRKGGDLRDSKGRKIDHDIVVRFESVREYRQFTQDWLPHAVARLKPAAPLIIWTNFLGKEPILGVAKSCGYGHLWGEFVWAKKTKPGNGSEQLLRVYEIALVLQAFPRPALSMSAPPMTWSVVSGYDEDGQGRDFGSHPHHKPFAVIEPLVRAYSQPGALVLDPFAGSGSIPAAALRLQRRTACLEKNPEWATRVSKRLSGASE